MATLKFGSQGTDVTTLQSNLQKLGFYAGKSDGAFGVQTELSVKDFQHRGVDSSGNKLKPDGEVGPNTDGAIRAALSVSPPIPFSSFAKFKKTQDDMFDKDEADSEHFSFLDRGIDEVKKGDIPSSPNRKFAESPYKSEIPNYPASLLVKPDSTSLLPHPNLSGKFAPYPALGIKPNFDNSLDFLSEDIQQACLCIGSFDASSNFKARWLERNGLNNVQFWSATKYLQVLNVVCQANQKDSTVNIADCNIKGNVKDDEGKNLLINEKFEDLLVDMVSYRKGVDRSNAIAKTFKNFRNKKFGTDDQPVLEKWVSKVTGNDSLLFHGGYGASLYIPEPTLIVRSSGSTLVAFDDLGEGSNRISAYDLVRAITMLGWHNHLSPTSQLPAAQWHSLSSVIQCMGTDTARYVDVALHELGLESVIKSPVIISKLGFGTIGNITIDALTYAAFVQFIDTRTTPNKLRTFSFALRIPTTAADAPRHDAKMASEVTEIVRRVVNEELV